MHQEIRRDWNVSNDTKETQHRAASNLLGALEGVVVARNVRHNRTFIRFRSVDQIYLIAIVYFFKFSVSLIRSQLMLVFINTVSVMVPYDATLESKFEL